jgi:hypothetical protein
VVHYRTGGKLTRIYPDGRTEDRIFTEGQVLWVDEATYAVKNTGTKVVTLMGVEVKYRPP